MVALLESLAPIVLCLLLGWLCGRFFKASWQRFFSRCIGFFVWLLLAAIGYQFALRLDAMGSVSLLLAKALYFAVGITVFVGLGTLLFFKKRHHVHHNNPDAPHAFWHILKECAIALGFVVLGALLEKGLGYGGWASTFAPNINDFLYVLLWLIGVDLAKAPFSWQQLNRRTFFLPFLIVLFSWIAGIALAWVLGMSVKEGLLVSSGFGWFSLSGVLVTAQLGEAYGMLSLMTDLFRELFSIVVLFFVGANYPMAGVAATAATGMDTTLPIIKKTCGNTFVPAALWVGGMLSLIAPFSLSFALSLF